MPHVFEYAVLRVIPRIERGECVNVGVLVYSAPLNFLKAAVHLDEARLRALDPTVDLAAVEAQLSSLRAVCAGGPAAGAAGTTTIGRRFRWLTAPRSTIIQAAPAHTGLTDDPERELAHLLRVLVLPPGEVARRP
ncbi:DUF3037 domain-containing protein [Solihabitans fulvus]|uniref:DUF3037 domain-containing protein n=1 Tax=Solihabitans fulvus TaxID=1892852 RepID=UPI001CB7632D|nr:DUF3037 domain-containing protein [Solihabitans fulvus]